jgi:pyridoxamine 5'-phosphate oxidase
MNEKNSLGLDKCFLDLDSPFELFTNWMEEAIKNEINDPNALSLATTDKSGKPSVRMVLLKGINEEGFIFYTNLKSKKSLDLKENPQASMCFYWKSLLRQITIDGVVDKVTDQVADHYFNSRIYDSRIGAWASNQSEILQNKEELLRKIEKYKKKFSNQKNIPRPPHWSGWCLIPDSIEFWLRGENRIHERLKYNKVNDGWKKILLYP